MNKTTASDGQLPLDLPGAAPSAAARDTAERTAPLEFTAPEPGPGRYAVVATPIGDLLLRGDGRALTGVHFDPAPPEGAVHDPASLQAAADELSAYFAGELTRFTVALAPAGTPFQLRVWAALTTIPYGATSGYGALAADLGAPGAARAVGGANNRNPIPIIVPCHRIVGANGSLTGYAGGLDRKRALLALEASSRPGA
ncbi:methylated-DNA--[protein]-cysteine S-methyltransferase [Nocardiopsis coralliicola]